MIKIILLKYKKIFICFLFIVIKILFWYRILIDNRKNKCICQIIKFFHKIMLFQLKIK